MYKIILAGYGGQGMLLCGQLLAYAAMTDGRHVTWFPSYGPEMRGGAAACTVIISEKPVGSPVAQYVDIVAAMSQPALEKYHGAVKDGGTLLYNSALVSVPEKRANIHYLGIDFSHLGTELGNSKAVNMIVLGSLNELLQCVAVSSIHSALVYKFGENNTKLLELNKKALQMGQASISAEVSAVN